MDASLGRYVFMDQGSELYRSPKILKLFQKRGFKIHPTGADALHQNGPVEQGHWTIAKGIRVLLTGAGLPA